MFQLHPDVHVHENNGEDKKDANSGYLAIAEAYAVLSKPKDKLEYDLGLHRKERFEVQFKRGDVAASRDHVPHNV